MENVTFKDFIEVVNYRITEGSPYLWTCYGPNAFCLDSWDNRHDGHSSSIVFDTITQEVYEMTVCDYKRNRAYRWQNPNYIQLYNKEAEYKVDSSEKAWDDVNYIHLHLKEDILAKTKAIVNNLDYDTRVSIPINLSDSELLQLMLSAHEKDVTLNQMVEEILTNALLEKNVKKHDK